MSDSNFTIKCPQCQTSISVDEVLSGQIEEKYKLELGAERKKHEEEFIAKLEIEKKKLWAVALEKAGERVKSESDKLQVESEKREKEFGLLKEELEQQKKKRAEAEAVELELRKEKNRLDEDRKTFELEKQRQMDAERAKIREEAIKTYAETSRLKEAEKDKLIDDLKKQAEEFKRKAEQGSQQSQGEVLELELEENLKAEFPVDEIAPVPKGINGADIIQKVRDQRGHLCGSIAWELKQTKAWTEGWVQKLKDDQRKVKAEIAILVSVVLPEGVTEAGFYHGIYVASPKMALGIARILRRQIVEIASALSLEEGKEEKKDLIFSYLLGPEFRGRIEGFIESAIAMKSSLEREKRAYTKIWAEREKLIDRIESSMAGLYGDVKGIAGNSLPQIKSLELESGEEVLEEEAETIIATVVEANSTVDNVVDSTSDGSESADNEDEAVDEEEEVVDVVEDESSVVQQLF